MASEKYADAAPEQALPPHVVKEAPRGDTGDRAIRAKRRSAAPSAPAIQPLVLNEADAARALGLSAGTLARLRTEGGGPVFLSLAKRRIGYTVIALEQFVATRQQHRSTADGRPPAPSRRS